MRSSPVARLMFWWPESGNRMSHPLPLPDGLTPCEFVARVGGIVMPELRRAVWWVQPATTPRNSGSVPGDTTPTPETLTMSTQDRAVVVAAVAAAVAVGIAVGTCAPGPAPTQNAPSATTTGGRCGEANDPRCEP